MPVTREMPSTRPAAGAAEPTGLEALLAARDDSDRDAAWARFVEVHSGLLLRLARSLGGDYDAAMDCYAFMLVRLRNDDFKKLRRYCGSSGAKFSTWLTVVARRLCLDHYRERRGRSRVPGGGALTARRRAIANACGDAADVEALPDLTELDPPTAVSLDEIRAALSLAIRDLDRSDRLLLAHRFNHGRKAGEIASLLGYDTPFHVYRRLRTVCSRLRRRLEQRGIREAQP